MHDAKLGSSSIIVGVIPGQPDRVVEEACRMAASMAASTLHLVYVNSTLTEENGHMEPLDSDSMSETWREDSSRLSEHVLRIARDAGIDAEYHLMAGDPVKELAKFAHSHDASMIVVGTRERGALAALQEWANGSVSLRLAHTQHIAILTVPLAGQYEN
ncbi:MAG: universal stress protein [Bifidobacterium aquikefiri]|uniref:Universal stress protein UspA n=1 Tax=Bifidobacterium aquikefiri TaxID=1653207 RepID=A0A261G3P0_9BIFI|nr:universal stress protein [Bifidobacterium aquikefiri]OZG66030.1 universal stress protein UspA [Bifidobacterium aquikefiri]